jgi:hypothetical protein
LRKRIQEARDSTDTLRISERIPLGTIYKSPWPWGPPTLRFSHKAAGELLDKGFKHLLFNIKCKNPRQEAATPLPAEVSFLESAVLAVRLLVLFALL